MGQLRLKRGQDVLARLLLQLVPMGQQFNLELIGHGEVLRMEATERAGIRLQGVPLVLPAFEAVLSANPFLLSPYSHYNDNEECICHINDSYTH